MIEKLFLSVGAMKAGTTWLYDKLKQHPDIHFSPQKEVHFLSHYYGHTNSLLPVKRQRRARIAMQAIRAKKKTGTIFFASAGGMQTIKVNQSTTYGSSA
jgi:hypothetical protein